jgi:hypothetical protein
MIFKSPIGTVFASIQASFDNLKFFKLKNKIKTFEYINKLLSQTLINILVTCIEFQDIIKKSF